MSQPNKCKVCGHQIDRTNKSGLCNRHYRLNYYRRRRYREKKKAEHKCVECRIKVNPIVTYPDGEEGIKIIKYPARCYKCRKKQNEYYKNKKMSS